MLASESRGHDLRSRCLLVPRVIENDGKEQSLALRLETVGRDGKPTPVELNLSEAIKLFNDAVKGLPPEVSFEKPAGEALVELTPSPKLTELVKRSRELAAAGSDVGDE